MMTASFCVARRASMLLVPLTVQILLPCVTASSMHARATPRHNAPFRSKSSTLPMKMSAYQSTGQQRFRNMQFLAAHSVAIIAASTTLQASLAFDEPWGLEALQSAVQKGEIERVDIRSRSGSAKLLRLTAIAEDGSSHAVQVFPRDQSELLELLESNGVKQGLAPPPFEDPAEQQRQTIGLAIIAVVSLLPTILVGFMLGQTLMRVRGFMHAGTSVEEEPPEDVANFNSVAGCDGAKAELMEMVDFLTNATRFEELGARVPRGCLLEGPPGTGKTLLARAVASEAGVDFIAMAGSDFVEMYVGVGASRVRNLFERAREKAPCVVFIDEIDSVGGTRTATGSGRSDERDQTLNQMLVEMDGFGGASGVMVLAATNRADLLDPALLRPGRFDRRVRVDLPDVRGRLDILQVHTQKKPLSLGVDLGLVAKRTVGFSGAALAALMNEAAIIAARANATAISYDEIDAALDRATVGLPARAHGATASKARAKSFVAAHRLAAYHEAGHAVVGLLTPDFDGVQKVSILPYAGKLGGITLFTPSEEQLESGLYSKTYLMAQLSVALGGRVAEEIVLGEDEVTTRGANDLQQVRRIARRMVAQWGFGGSGLGGVAWESDNDWGTPSRETAREIDAEVLKIVTHAYETSFALLSTHRDLLDEIANELLEQETVGAEKLAEMAAQHGGAPLQVLIPASSRATPSKEGAPRRVTAARRFIVRVKRVLRANSRQPLRLLPTTAEQAKKTRTRARAETIEEEKAAEPWDI